MSSVLDRLKSSDASAMQTQNQTVESMAPSKKRADYHSYDEGDNRFRIYPPHPDGVGKTIWEPKCVSWMIVPVEILNKEKKGTGKFENKPRPIFNARFHLGAVKDPVEVYMDFYERVLKQEQEAIKQGGGNFDYSIIKDFKSKYFYSKTRLAPKLSWVMYADKIVNGISEFGRLEITDGLKKKIEADLINVYAGDGPMGDPFSDKDDGYVLVITKDKEADANNYYKPRIDQVKKGNTMELQTRPLTEAQAEHFINQTPLSDTLRGAYKKSDLEKQLQGLEILDETISETEGRPLLFEDSNFREEITACIDQIMELLPKEEEENVEKNDPAYNELPFDAPEDKQERKSSLSAEDHKNIESQINKLRAL